MSNNGLGPASNAIVADAQLARISASAGGALVKSQPHTLPSERMRLFGK